MAKPSQQTKIRTVQTWLNSLLRLSPPLELTGKLDRPTIAALKQFQASVGLRESGKLTADTWRAFGRTVGTIQNFFDPLQHLPASVQELVFGRPAHVMRYDRNIFTAEYMAHFRGLDQEQIGALDTVLHFIEQDSEITDHRWTAYMLATVKLECANTWRPIAEYGCNDTTGCTATATNARTYGQPRRCPADLREGGAPLTTTKVCPAGKTTHTYYGRGYVQLTHAGNYKRLGEALGLGESLLHYPERVMVPQTAYRIMSHGMRNGTFTGKKLSDYINARGCDYFNARRIINGITAANREHVHAFERNCETLDDILVDSLH